MVHICPRCSRQYATTEALQQHTAVSHPSATSRVANHPCRDCNRQFSSKEALDQHRSAAHRTPSPSIPCSNCNRLFHSREALDQHTLDSHRTPNVPCQDCNKKFHSQDALRQHAQASHTKYPCDKCNKTLTSQESLDQHRTMKHLMITTPIRQLSTPPTTYQSPVRVSQGGFSAPVTSSDFYARAPNHIPLVFPLQTSLEHIEITPRNNHNMMHRQSTSESLPQVPDDQSRVNQDGYPQDETGPKVYQNIMTLLHRKAFVKNMAAGGTNGQKTPLDELRTQRSKMQGRDVIASLVNSDEYLSDLMKVSHTLECSESEIRGALEKDEASIANLLRSTLNSAEEKRQVLALQGDEAERFLTFMDKIMAKNRSLFQGDGEAESRTAVHYLLVKLSETSGILPSSLNISGVKDCDKDPVTAGGFADIYRASYNGECVALKRLREYASDAQRQRDRRQFCREALVWQDLRHPYVLPFYGIDISTFCPKVCMVSPWMDNGTVLRFIKNSAVPLKANLDINRYLYEIAQGLSFLHSKRVIHGDLKGANILIDEDRHARLADFGLTGFENATLASKTTNHHGSIQWMAPELHDPEQFGLLRFKRTTDSDVYAFACVCLEMHTLKCPFGDLRDSTVIYNVVSRGERPGRPTGADEKPMSDDLWALVEECWKDIRKGRPSMMQVLNRIEAMR